MMTPNSTYAPWGGLLTASPYGSQQAPWDAQTSAPWRMSPWSTQGMPSGAPIQSFTPQLGLIPQLSAQSSLPQLSAQSYRPQGTAGTLQDFNPMVPGGGFYPGLLGGGKPAPAPAPAPAQRTIPRATMGTAYRGDPARYTVGGRRYTDYGQAMERAALLDSRARAQAQNSPHLRPQGSGFNTRPGAARQAMARFF